MASYTFNFGGKDNVADGDVDQTAVGGLTVDTVGVGSDFPLSAGDPVQISGTFYTYTGGDGAGGGIFDADVGNDVWWVSDTTDIQNGDTIPTAVPGDDLTCFAPGTLITTPDGERAVEDLKIGDRVLTTDGRETQVLWIGRQVVSKLFTPAERFVPVRVKAGALSGGLPHTDLVLTADHALVIDGIAINAGALVNGTTIAYDPIESMPDSYTYYHVETEGHEVILANGAPAETYVDYIQRRAFSNYAEYEKLYGDERTISEMSIPRISSARLLPPEIRDRLAGQFAA